jgi:hypothetical protein
MICSKPQNATKDKEVSSSSLPFQVAVCYPNSMQNNVHLIMLIVNPCPSVVLTCLILLILLMK